MTHGEPMPNTPAFFWCEKCGFYHTPVYAFCDALAAQSLFDRAEATLERQRTLPNAPAIAKAVDDWLLMERKARAWDALYARAHDDLSLLALMERLVQPAQTDV